MKKFTFLVAALCATMMASAAVIQIDDFNSVALAATQANQTVTVQGVTLSFNGTIVDATYEGKTYRTLRVYAGKTLTVSCAEKITKIEVIGMAKKDANVTASAGTVVGGSFSADTYAYENGFDEPLFVINDVNATSTVITPVKQIRLYGIRVTTGEGGGSEGGEEGGEEGGDAIVIEGLAYADAYWDTAYHYRYWLFDLYKDYDSESKILTYPEVYFSVTGGTETTIADDDIMFDPYKDFYTEHDDFAVYVKAAGDTIFFGNGTVSIVAKGEGVYAFDCTFEDKDGQAYTFKTEVEVYASAVTWDEATEDWVYEDVVLTDEASTAIRTVEIDNTVYARDGRIYAEEGARIYSLTGLDVTRMNGNLEGIYIVKNGNKVAKVAVAK